MREEASLIARAHDHDAVGAGFGQIDFALTAKNLADIGAFSTAFVSTHSGHSAYVCLRPIADIRPCSSVDEVVSGEEIPTLVVIVAAALVAAQGVQSLESKAVPQIVVEGSGSAKNPPNVAEISYEIEGEGQTSDQAVTALVSKSAAVEGALRSMDAALNLHSTTVRVQAVRKGGCKEDQYDKTARLSTGECAVVGFVATQDFDVRTAKVADAGTMVGLASRQGASDPKIDSFGLVDQRGARQQAIAAALADARSKAEAVAAGSNSRLGDVISIALDGARSRDIVVTGTLHQRNNREAGAPVTVLVTPGPVVTSAQVTVTYAIAR